MNRLLKTVGVFIATVVACLMATPSAANAAEPSHRIFGYGEATAVPTNLVGGLVIHTVGCQIVAAGPRLAELRMTVCSINNVNKVPAAGVLGQPDATGASVATFTTEHLDYYPNMHVCWHGIAYFVAFLSIPAEAAEVDNCSDI